MLSDNFPGSDPGEVWAIYNSGGATAAETSGEMVVTLPNANPTTSYASFTTNRYYDLLGDSASVEVTNAANTATAAYAYFRVDDGNGNLLEISQRMGMLYFIKNVAATWTVLKSTSYSPTNHRYWRFREDGVNTYWETSSDGVTWVVQTQAPTTSLFALNFVEMVIGGGTNGGEVSPGSVHFANVNGGGTPTGKWCPVSSLTDNFAATSRSSAWKRGSTSGPETVAQGSGKLVFTLAPNAIADASYVSSASYRLTGSAVLIQVPQTANTAASGQTLLRLNGPGHNFIQMLEQSGQLYFRLSVGGNTMNLGSVAYSPTEHVWWRIRESGGTLFWETAADGKTWVVQQQLSPLPFAIDVLDVVIESGTYVSQPNPGASHYANLNLPPP